MKNLCFSKVSIKKWRGNSAVKQCVQHIQSAKKERLRDQEEKGKTRDGSCDQPCHRRGTTDSLLTWTHRLNTLHAREGCHCDPRSATTFHTPSWQKGKVGSGWTNIQSGSTKCWWTWGDTNALLSFGKRPWAVSPHGCGGSYPTGVPQLVCSPQEPPHWKQDQCTGKLTEVWFVMV